MGAANDGFGGGDDDRRHASPFGDLEPGARRPDANLQNACPMGRPVSRRVAYFRSMLGGIFEVGANQIDMADAQRQGQFVKRDDGRIAPRFKLLRYCWLKPERSSTCS
jgi:hypothetical protein